MYVEKVWLALQSNHLSMELYKFLDSCGKTDLLDNKNLLDATILPVLMHRLSETILLKDIFQIEVKKVGKLLSTRAVDCCSLSWAVASIEEERYYKSYDLSSSLHVLLCKELEKKKFLLPGILLFIYRDTKTVKPGQLGPT